MQQMLHLVAGAVIGGLIGYFTNFIAIQMLFHPRTEKKIGNFTIPFTPGVIPRRKDQLAREIGEAVAEKVFTEEDIREIFLSEGMQKTVAEGMFFWEKASLQGEGRPNGATGPDEGRAREGSGSVYDLMEAYLPAGQAQSMVRRLDEMMREKLHGALERNDMSDRIAWECRGQIRDRVRGTVAARVLTEEKIQTLSDYLGRYLQHYVRVHADDLIMPILREELGMVLGQPADRLIADAGIERRTLEEMGRRVYSEFMAAHCMDVVGQFDIAGLTREKIIAFRAEEIESLVNRTIKREMRAVVRLGGLLGVVIGFVAALL